MHEHGAQRAFMFARLQIAFSFLRTDTDQAERDSHVYTHIYFSCFTLLFLLCSISHVSLPLMCYLPRFTSFSSFGLCWLFHFKISLGSLWSSTCIAWKNEYMCNDSMKHLVRKININDCTCQAATKMTNQKQHKTTFMPLPFFLQHKSVEIWCVQHMKNWQTYVHSQHPCGRGNSATSDA